MTFNISVQLIAFIVLISIYIIWFIKKIIPIGLSLFDYERGSLFFVYGNLVTIFFVGCMGIYRNGFLNSF